MKRFKKLVSVMLATVTTMAMTFPVMAADATPQKPQGPGSITVMGSTNGDVAANVEGKQYELFQILTAEMVDQDDPAKGIIYRVPAQMKEFFEAAFPSNDKDPKYGENGYDEYITTKIADLAEVEPGTETENETFEAFANKALEWVTDSKHGITPIRNQDDAVAVEGGYKFEKLPLGYYLVHDMDVVTTTDENGNQITVPVSAVILNTTTPDAQVNIKASQPTLDKKIDGDKDTDETKSGLVSDNNVAIGDTVPFVLRTNVPDMRGYKKYSFIVSDSLSRGLTFNNDVTISINNTDGTIKKTLQPNVDFEVVMYTSDQPNPTPAEGAESTVTTDPQLARSFEIVFKNMMQYESEEFRGLPIVIKYTAELNENAVIGTIGNENTATLTYSTNPSYTPTGEPDDDRPEANEPKGETPESKTITFVTSIELIKVDPNGKKLTGAQFQIIGTKLNTVLVSKVEFEKSENGTYWKLKDGTFTTTDPAGEGVDNSKYENTTTKYVKKVTDKVPTEKSENVTYTGTVDESGILAFEGLSNGTYTIKELKAPEGYNLLKEDLEFTITYTAPEGDATTCTWNVNGPGASIVDGVVQVKVVNNTGAELPSTGGIGTTIFYIIGSILVVGAAILLVTKKRIGKEA